MPDIKIRKKSEYQSRIFSAKALNCYSNCFEKDLETWGKFQSFSFRPAASENITSERKLQQFAVTAQIFHETGFS